MCVCVDFFYGGFFEFSSHDTHTHRQKYSTDRFFFCLGCYHDDEVQFSIKHCIQEFWKEKQIFKKF